MMRPNLLFACLGLGAALLSACDSDEAAGAGEVRVLAGGGAAIAQGFPSQEGAVTHAFADGWSLTFSRYLLVVGGFQLSDPDGGAVDAEWRGPAVIDLAAGQGADQLITSLPGVSASRHDVGFELVVADATATAASATKADVDLLVENGWSFYVEGAATKAGRTVSFGLGFAAPARYSACTNGVDNTRGVAPVNQSVVDAYLYSHAVHLFWDTLGETDQNLRFDALAAVADADGHLSADALKTQDLNDLRDANGDPLLGDDGQPLFYRDNGLLDRSDQTLHGFIAEAVRQSIHFNGVGLCRYARLD